MQGVEGGRKREIHEKMMENAVEIKRMEERLRSINRFKFRRVYNIKVLS